MQNLLFKKRKKDLTSDPEIWYLDQASSGTASTWIGVKQGGYLWIKNILIFLSLATRPP